MKNVIITQSRELLGIQPLTLPKFFGTTQG